MFLAAIEVDLSDFKRNTWKSILFGMATFLIPMSLGMLANSYILQFGLLSSVLLASIYASHTLIAYPIVSRFGVTKQRSVNITVGGTMITNVLALLVLAGVVSMAGGQPENSVWLRMGISATAFAVVVMFGFPPLARWFFKEFNASVSQYIFVLGLVFLAAFLAQVAGMESIIGAFLAGFALNRLIPHTSPLMNRIEFVGNALFIPLLPHRGWDAGGFAGAGGKYHHIACCRNNERGGNTAQVCRGGVHTEDVAPAAGRAPNDLRTQQRTGSRHTRSRAHRLQYCSR